MKIDARLDHGVIPAGAPTVVHILLTLTAPNASKDTQRPRLNIAAVIDRSGSMDGAPLDYAKQSVRLLLDQLGPDDRFSLVVYDDEVLPLVEGVRTNDKTQLKSIVEQIETGGMTNLSGGWIKGVELVNRENSKEDVNAVLLLTDGQANEGITDPDKLVSLGKDVNDKQSIRTTCMGLGEHFNEDLLRDIATAAGGRFHYIESPEHAPAVFEEELGGLLEVVAQNVEIELKVADGITGIAQLTGYAWKSDGPDCRLVIGDFGAEQVKHVLLAVELPAVSDLKNVLIASMTMNFAEVGSDSVQIKSQKQDLIVGVSAESESRPADPEVLLHIGLQYAAKARKDAVSNIDEGDIDGATRVLESNRDKLKDMASSAADPARLESEADELDRRAQELRESKNVRENRKFMVSEGSAMSQANYSSLHASRKRRKPRGQSKPPTGGDQPPNPSDQ
ncbi:MAG: VWA domain-containing protein [Verrucomicrobiales bacterium]